MRSRRNRIALGCSLSACMMIVAATVVSAFWSVTYLNGGFDANLSGGIVNVYHGSFLQGFGPPRPQGFGVRRSPNPGLGFDRPDYQYFRTGHTHLKLPLWLPFAVLGVMSIGLWRLGRPLPGVPPGHCQQCGYDVRANSSGVCSECGAKFQASTAAR